MSAFEDTLVAELRAEADRASSATDSGAMRVELRRRLDESRTRSVKRRWTYAVAAVAAAAVVIGLAVVANGRLTAEVPPADGGRWTGTDLYTKPQLQLPEWAAGITPVVAAPRVTRWAQDECGRNPCAPGKDRLLEVFLPLTEWDPATSTSGPVLTWEQAADYFGRLTERAGVVPVAQPAFTQQATLGAGVANVAVITTTDAVPGTLGCATLKATLADCQSFAGGTRNVIALINAGDAPLVVWSSALASTDAAAQDAEMTQVLSSLKFTGVPVSCTTSVTREKAQATCADDLFAWVQRDATRLADGGQANQSHFDAAVGPYAEAVSDQAAVYLNGYSRGPFDGDNFESTKPTTASFTVGGKESTVNVCFIESQVLLIENPCPS